MITKAKIKIIIPTITVILVFALTYAINAEYSMADISADNYKTKLKESDASLFESGIDNIIPETFSLNSSNKYLTSDNFENNGIKVTNDNGNHIEIHSTRTQLNYWVTFTEGKMTSVWIFKQALLDSNSRDTQLIKEIIDKLILDNGFLLKRTDMKRGSDIVIKEIESCFIIGSFYSYDEQPLTSNITISTFSKKKYF